jgi:type IV pilus assembly protein PilY1
LIVKRPSDGKWVVILSSGHNNVSPGNGKGYVYVIDAQTGAILQRLATGVGCDGVSSTAPCTAGTVDPSGLTRLNAWVENSAEDNTALTVYGGDLKGNLWRFELAGTASVTANSVTRLTTLVDGSGNAQPVTTRPELGLVGASSRIVYVGTGKFLGTSDNATDRRQSVYAIKDTMAGVTSPVYSAIRSDSNFIQQTLSAISGDRRTASNNSVDLLTASGWYIDLPDGGSGSPSERVSVDPVLQLGTLIIPSNVPSTDACVAGGYGWVNFLNARTGSFITNSTDNMASTKIAASLIVGINVVRLPGGTVKVIVTTADNQQLTESAPVAPATAQGRRVSWRELSVDR